MQDLVKINKLIKFYSNIQCSLKDEKCDLEKLDVIIVISHNCEEIIESFDYDFERLYNKIVRLNDDISSGNVYKILEEGNLEEDGFEKGYLFLTLGSSILLHYHRSEKEYYKHIYGDKEAIKGCFCNIDQSHEITSVNDDTIVRTYKYIPKSMVK